MLPDCSPEEWQLRIELAAVYRLVDHFGWSELIWTHNTVRIPGHEHEFLINPYGFRFDEITASNLVKVDWQGNILSGAPEVEINPAGFIIHSAIHMARPDIRCIVHTHTVAGMAVAALECGLLPVSMYALGFFEQVAYHAFEGPSVDADERARLGADLGGNQVMVMRNHGLLACGDTIAQAFVRMYRLERACQVQLAAQASRSQLIIPPREVCELSRERSDAFLSTEGGRGYSRNANPEFAALLRMLDRKDPSYRQ